MLGDDLGQEARNEGSDKYSSWVGMVYPLLISSTMVLLTVKMHDFMTVLENGSMAIGDVMTNRSLIYFILVSCQFVVC